jgi:ubiquinone/menaquinone biosynthesis C-methylase UbiE
MNTTLQFNGQIPRHYEDLLSPFLFDAFSADLIERINFATAHNVLELASGTGSVTKQLLLHLPPGSHLTATDLEPAMLEVAKQQVSNTNVSWDVVDMTNIPYADGQYDLIVCQFGLMLVPEKLKALSEMYRVLKKGGRLVFSVWAEIENNPVWDISGKVIETFFGSNPMLQNPGPFSLSVKEDALQLLENVGFRHTAVSAVARTGTVASAAMATTGFIQGLPVFTAISKKDPSLISQIEKELELQLSARLGNLPLQSPLKAWVFETSK